MSFNKGDRVRYSGKGKTYNDPDAVGALGTVEYYNSKDDVVVAWDKDCGKYPALHVFAANLELVKPEFKVGDRVVGQRRGGEVVTGEITALYPDRFTTVEEYLVRVDGEDREVYIVKNTAVSAPEPELADWERELLEPVTPAVGTKVRVTYEGVVTETKFFGPGFKIETENGKFVFVGTATHHTEVLADPEPEPYAEATVAKLKSGTVVRAGKKDTWVWTGTGETSDIVTDEWVRERIASGKGEILHDPADDFSVL